MWTGLASLMWSRLTVQDVHNPRVRSCSPFTPALQPNDLPFRGHSVESVLSSPEESLHGDAGSPSLSSSSWGISTVSESFCYHIAPNMTSFTEEFIN